MHIFEIKYIIRPGARGSQPRWKGKYLFLFIIDVYRLENRKMEVCRVSGGGGTHGLLGTPRDGTFHK